VGCEDFKNCVLNVGVVQEFFLETVSVDLLNEGLGIAILAVVGHGQFVIEVSFDVLLEGVTDLARANVKLRLVGPRCAICRVRPHLDEAVLAQLALKRNLTTSVQNHTEE